MSHNSVRISIVSWRRMTLSPGMCLDLRIFLFFCRNYGPFYRIFIKLYRFYNCLQYLHIHVL